MLSAANYFHKKGLSGMLSRVLHMSLIIKHKSSGDNLESLFQKLVQIDEDQDFWVSSDQYTTF